MSKHKAPYKHYRLCDEAPCVKGNCMACVYEEGRASRDGLRKALEYAIGVIKDTNGCSCDEEIICALCEIKKALEADRDGYEKAKPIDTVPGYAYVIHAARDEGMQEGIAEGLRMAAEMFRNSKWKAYKDGVKIQDFDFHQEVLAKAKEVEEGKGEK